MDPAHGISRRIAGRLALAAAILTLSAALTIPAAAQEAPPPQGQPEAAPAPAAPAPARSLADVAGRIQLNRTAVGEDGRIVISNQNLGKLAGDGRISVAGAVGSAATAPAATASQTPADALRGWQQEYEAQFLKVHDLEYDLQDFERRVEESQDPYFPFGPHDRAPETRSPNQVISERGAAELEAERRKLEQIRRDAARQGFELKEPEYRRPESERQD